MNWSTDYLEKDGIVSMKTDQRDTPVFKETQTEEANGNWKKAAQIYGYMGEHYKNEISFLESLAVRIFTSPGEATKWLKSE